MIVRGAPQRWPASGETVGNAAIPFAGRIVLDLACPDRVDLDAELTDYLADLADGGAAARGGMGTMGWRGIGERLRTSVGPPRRGAGVGRRREDPPRRLRTSRMRGRRSAGAWHARKEHPARVSEYDEPEPDVAVVMGTRAALRSRHPLASEIPMVAEVAGTTLAEDRGLKQERYARAGIPIYWIVNLVDRLLEVRRRPITSDAAPYGWTYQATTVLGPDASVSPVSAPFASILVADLLP